MFGFGMLAKYCVFDACASHTGIFVLPAGAALRMRDCWCCAEVGVDVHRTGPTFLKSSVGTLGAEVSNDVPPLLRQRSRGLTCKDGDAVFEEVLRALWSISFAMASFLSVA